MASRKKIGLLGGAFDPCHKGHVAMATLVLKEGWVSEVWVIPCWQHPFEKKMADFEHRLKMCELGFRELGGGVKVLDVERKLGGVSYTLKTVEHLLKQHTGLHFFLILGKDAADEASRWHGTGELKEKVEWLTLPRGKGSPIPDVSASGLRRAIAEKGEWMDNVPPTVAAYIKKNKLYQEGI